MSSAVLYWVLSRFLARPVERKGCSVEPEDSLRPFFRAFFFFLTVNRPGVGQNVDLLASPTTRNYVCPITTVPVHWASLFFFFFFSLSARIFFNHKIVCDVPAGSPLDGGMSHFMSDINRPSLPTPFSYALVSTSVLWPFQLCFIPYLLPTTLRFLTLFFWSSYLIGPFN